MNLLLLTADYPPYAWSGVAASVECQANALASLGIAVHVLTRSLVARTLWPPPAAKVRSIAGQDQFPWMRTRGIYSSALARVRRVGAELRKRIRAPLVYTAHALLDRELENPWRGPWAAIQRAVMDACEAVIFLNEEDRAGAVATQPSLASRSRVVRHGLPAPPRMARVWRPCSPIVFRPFHASQRD